MENSVKKWMVNYIASVLTINEEDIKVESTFDTLGVDSVEAVIMAGLLEEKFCLVIDPMEMYKNPSINAFAKHLSTRLMEQKLAQTVE